METSRITAECMLCSLLTGIFSQLIKVFYRTSQINYLAFMFLRILTCALIIGAVFYLKRNREIGELMFLIFAVLVGLWTEN